VKNISFTAPGIGFFIREAKTAWSGILRGYYNRKEGEERRDFTTKARRHEEEKKVLSS